MLLSNRSRIRLLAGMALSVSALLAPLAGDTGAESARIVLANFSFTPNDLQLSAGKPVVLHFVNEGSGGHNFVAPEFFADDAMVGVVGMNVRAQAPFDVQIERFESQHIVAAQGVFPTHAAQADQAHGTTLTAVPAARPSPPSTTTSVLGVRPLLISARSPETVPSTTSMRLSLPSLMV